MLVEVVDSLIWVHTDKSPWLSCKSQSAWFELFIYLNYNYWFGFLFGGGDELGIKPNEINGSRFLSCPRDGLQFFVRQGIVKHRNRIIYKRANVPRPDRFLFAVPSSNKHIKAGFQGRDVVILVAPLARVTAALINARFPCFEALFEDVDSKTKLHLVEQLTNALWISGLLTDR